MTLDETFNFHKYLVGWIETKSDILDKAKKKDFTKNKPEEDSVHALASGMNGDKGTRVRQDPQSPINKVATIYSP